jgi:hypothetical protein
MPPAALQPTKGTALAKSRIRSNMSGEGGSAATQCSGRIALHLGICFSRCCSALQLLSARHHTYMMQAIIGTAAILHNVSNQCSMYVCTRTYVMHTQAVLRNSALFAFGYADASNIPMKHGQSGGRSPYSSSGRAVVLRTDSATVMPAVPYGIH